MPWWLSVPCAGQEADSLCGQFCSEFSASFHNLGHLVFGGQSHLSCRLGIGIERSLRKVEYGNRIAQRTNFGFASVRTEPILRRPLFSERRWPIASGKFARFISMTIQSPRNPIPLT